MAYVIGIDTGGTYTDAVLIDTDKCGTKIVLRKAKAITTHDELKVGIKNSITSLSLLPEEITRIEKIVLSTTLATNAIVEMKIHEVGLILIGDIPMGKLAAKHIEMVPGKVNIKGRVLVNLDIEKTESAVKHLAPYVEAIAVSGAASIRNPVLENIVKEIVQKNCDLPVMCAHEFANEPGFLERTNTVVINAGLIPILNNFIDAIKKVLDNLNITAPVFIVKGDGSLAKMEAIKMKPIDTVLSGPAASIIGAINLADIDNAVVLDMGGTTTDAGEVHNKRVELSARGAVVGGWSLKIRSAKLNTFGLGGDSKMRIEGDEIKIGPERAIPSCRGGVDIVTPTDILHYTGEFNQWDRNKSIAAIDKWSKKNAISSEEYIDKAKKALVKQIFNNIISNHNISDLQVCAIGAPVKSWYGKVKEVYAFNLIVPENYEVANAVGAATAGIEEIVEAIVRQGEEGHGFLVHTGVARFLVMKLEDAINKGIEVSMESALQRISDQNLELDLIQISCKSIYSDKGKLIYKTIMLNNHQQLDSEFYEKQGAYLETSIKVSVSGKIFVSA